MATCLEWVATVAYLGYLGWCCLQEPVVRALLWEYLREYCSRIAYRFGVWSIRAEARYYDCIRELPI